VHRRAFVFASAGTGAALAGLLALSAPAAALAVGPSGAGTGGSPGFTACDAGSGQDAGAVSCNAVQLTDAAAWRGVQADDGAPGNGAVGDGAAGVGPVATTAPPLGYGPAELQQAYNLTTASAGNGRGRTVAIVDAYDDPSVVSDLSAYRAQYRLPPVCGGRAVRGCITFTKVNQRGVPFPLPSADPGWSQEISVDVDMVSAVCPDCNILLVESDSATFQSLGKAEDTAAAAGPVSIGNSFGSGEFRSETNADQHFQHPGIAITAAAGDDGYGVQWPASSPDVIAVGGTTLAPARGSARGWSETAWSGDGSGCSAIEPQPGWQSRIHTLRAQCAGRAVADVAAVADPDTGVAVYDTFDLPGWSVFGGTSVSTQIISAVYALAGGGSGPTGASGLYAASPRGFFDVTTGSDGSCGSLLCTATAGWDGPTGLGTPDGTGAF